MTTIINSTLCKRGKCCKKRLKKTRVRPVATVTENHADDYIELVPVNISDCDD